MIRIPPKQNYIAWEKDHPLDAFSKTLNTFLKKGTFFFLCCLRLMANLDI